MEYIVTLKVNEPFGESDVILVEADNFDACVEFAFFTRNIASSWNIIDIIGDDVPKFDTITYMDFAQWHSNRVNWANYYAEGGET